MALPIINTRINIFESYHGSNDVNEFENEADHDKIKEYANWMIDTYEKARKKGFQGKEADEINTVFEELRSKDEMTQLHYYIRNRLMDVLADSIDIGNDIGKIKTYCDMLEEMTGETLKEKLTEKNSQIDIQKQMVDLMDAPGNNVFKTVSGIIKTANNDSLTASSECKKLTESLYLGSYANITTKLIAPDKEERKDKGFMQVRESFLANKIKQENEKIKQCDAEIAKINKEIADQKADYDNAQCVYDEYSTWIAAEKPLKRTIEDKANSAQNAIGILYDTEHIKNSSNKFEKMINSYTELYNMPYRQTGRTILDGLTSFLDLSKAVSYNELFRKAIQNMYKQTDEYVKYKQKKLNHRFGNGKIRYQAAVELRDSLKVICNSFENYKTIKNRILFDNGYQRYNEAIDIMDHHQQKLDGYNKQMTDVINRKDNVKRNLDMYKKYKNIDKEVNNCANTRTNFKKNTFIYSQKSK